MEHLAVLVLRGIGRVSGEPNADDIERFFGPSSGACWRAEWLISAIEIRRSSR
jgi:hypothetical protein